MALLSRLWAAMRGAPLPYPRVGAGSTFWDPRTRTFALTTGAVETKLLRTKPEQLAAYQGWAYAAASLVAQDIRANPWAILRKSGDEEWTPIDEDAIPPVLERPTLEQSWGDFIETSSLHLDLTGELFWHLITAGGVTGGKLLGMQCLTPSWVREPLFSDDGLELVAWQIDIPGRPGLRLDARDLVFTRYPHPSEPFRGASPVEAFALSHELDTHARGYAVSLLKNRAQPDGILSSDQELTLEQANLIRERWKETHQTPGSIAVTGLGVKYQPTATTLKDMEFNNFANFSRDQIFAIYKVPASKVGLTTDVNRANSEAADATYKENAILPRLQRLEEKINLYIMPRLFGAKAASLWFEFESPVDEDREFELRKAGDIFSKGASTVNEYREALGLPTLDGAEGDLYFLPLGAKPVASLVEAAEAAKLAPPDDPDVGPEDEEPDEPTPEEMPEETPSPEDDEGERVLRVVGEHTQLVEAKFLRSQERLEAGLKSSARRIFSLEQGIVVDAYRAQTGERAFTTQMRGWIDDALEGTRDEWEGDIGEFISRGVKEGWLLAEDDLEDAIDFSIFEEAAKSYARKTAAKKVTAIHSTTREAVRKIIASAVETGLGVDETATLLREAYDGFKGARAETIARTETASAVNYGKLQHASQAAEELHLTTRKTWIATEDERTRESHLAADGQTVAVDQKFRVGQSFLDHPGDPSGPVEEVVRCRCTVTFESD